MPLTFRGAMNLRDAAPPQAFHFNASVELTAGAEGKARRFRGVAYSGLPVTDHPYWGQVVFDLASTKAEQRIPVLREHDPSKIVGHTEAVAIGADITVDGVFDQTDFSAEVATLSDAGFPWQMSVHINPGSIEEIKPGAQLSVNGHEVNGPAVVFKNARIREVSFCPVGADPNTSAVALSYFSKESNMPTPQELQAQIEQLTGQVTTLTANNAALTAQNKELSDRFTAQAAERRAVAIKDLFTAIGQDYTDEAAKPYVSLDETVFSAVAAQMKSLKAKAGEHLFKGQGEGQGTGSGKSALVLDAERRAAAGKR